MKPNACVHGWCTQPNERLSNVAPVHCQPSCAAYHALPPHRSMVGRPGAGIESNVDFLFRNPGKDYASLDLLERMVRDAALRFMVELLAG